MFTVKTFLFSSLILITTQIANADEIILHGGRWRGDRIVYVQPTPIVTTRIYTNRELEDRMYRLEQAVQQLQDRVYELQAENTAIKAEDDKTPKFTCFIKTNMKGTISSTKTSKTKAKVDVMQQCSDLIKYGNECDEDKVKCGD